MHLNITASDILYFWARVDQSEHTGCWPWLSTQSTFGHGTLSIKGQNYHAHRLAYMLVYGEIPTGLVVSHQCNNPPCCNPTHLRAITQRENLQYMQACGRGRKGASHYARTNPERLSRGDNHYARKEPHRLARGETHHKARLTEDEVRQIRQLWQEGSLTGVQLAARFNVHRDTIGLIVRRKSWQHVE